MEFTKNDIINVEVFEKDWRYYILDIQKYIEDVVASGGCKECAEQYINNKIKVIRNL